MMNNKEYLIKVIKLTSGFTHQHISGLEFEVEYMRLFREIRDADLKMGPDIEEVISEIFTDLDTFCGYPELMDEEDISEEELRRRVRVNLGKLRSYCVG